MVHYGSFTSFYFFQRIISDTRAESMIVIMNNISTIPMNIVEDPGKAATCSNIGNAVANLTIIVRNNNLFSRKVSLFSGSFFSPMGEFWCWIIRIRQNRFDFHGIIAIKREEF